MKSDLRKVRRYIKKFLNSMNLLKKLFIEEMHFCYSPKKNPLTFVLCNRQVCSILFLSSPDFNRRFVLVSSIVTKMCKPFHWHLKLLFDKLCFWLFNGIDVFMRRHQTSSAAVPCQKRRTQQFQAYISMWKIMSKYFLV